MEYLANTAIKVPFVGSATGLVSFPDLTILKDGVVSAQSTTVTEIGNKLYVLNVTIASTGAYTLFVNGQVQASFQIVSKTVPGYLLDLLDEAVGSWTWNKGTGVLTLLRQTGTTLATYNVIDTAATASREKI
jgi:hypothetical protein